MQQRLGVPSLPPAIADLLLEREVLTIEDGHAYLSIDEVQLYGLDLPRNLEGVLIQRLARLEPAMQQRVKVASVLGRDLRTSEAIGTESADGPVPTWVFEHAMVQDVAYSTLAFDQRVALHQTVAEFLQRAAEPSPALLAYHWERAEQPLQAVRYLDQAGTAALRAGASLEAARNFSHALALAGEPSTDAMRAARARWYRSVGMALGALGELRSSEEALERTLAMVGRPYRHGTVAQLWSALSMWVFQLAWLASPRLTEAATPELRSAWQEATLAATALSQAHLVEHDGTGSVYVAFFAGFAATRTGPGAARTAGMRCFGTALQALNLRWLGRLFERRA